VTDSNLNKRFDVIKQTVRKINIKGIKFMKHKFLKATALTRTIGSLKNT